MIIVTVTRIVSYYFQDCDIEAMAEDEGCSFEDCKAMLLGGEFELPEIEANCGFEDGVVENYQATEE